MSGIYIPGMEMPQKDEVITIFPDGTAHLHHLGLRLNISQSKAVPVPPHGRLGDLDELLKEVYRIYDQYDAAIISENACMNALALTIRNAPAIIPADHFRDATKMMAEEDEK